MQTAFVGLGANLGPAEASVRAAIATLGAVPQTTLIAASRLYRTPAWGHADQPDFINAVAQLRTGLAPLPLLEALLGIEQAFGRERRAGERWGPRTLDLDLLLYAEQVIDLPQLQVPHPHLHARAFALLPLSELAPQAIIPGHGTVRHALQAIDTCGLEPIG
ncbi:2-amino-4-hydroxy-6-hydroxymethyldihydropteridine diphosphokinase [Xanthomonas oryzae pv. oryzicola]|uniref:2-amino-4-hydroxy-6- hydroxymethyldihydropteridine diphosphokinase n=2 Tax=Xanthomonas oryzae TaxID=347 RepID=UPI0003F4F4EB|nr:2-amino-4-hydroxy-6-hydroxymethyldihydropteridine diphosphokinase [Xanthomonas oryzae]AJQ87431.1 2-amino-4-hydroxy-6-hydroxymethyldihydropteridine pyrophosphokinase [Xanthomonas oryzae pv. oryzicola]AKK63909.1 2-amino-4-hydroxy-6-hydroxymethyldihydropteridine pyrophosphokinase [Xanthomonas oryzae pv. oryzicola]AKO00972.1 2-amino-4-hydroxy-6-hydroxymethyldihydropteridine pyrophosphokinase [Xanthomonas oryzae pv. oryzicola]AKO04770.1 2-amino-4-hydroxy-6-hydroxymethyldihydropteridine pyrophosph